MPEPGLHPEDFAPEDRAREDRAVDDRALSTAAIAGAEPQRAPIDEPRAFVHEAEAAPVRADRPAALYSAEEAERLRGQCSEVQASFVDEPRRAVEQADNLVAIALKHLAEAFAAQRSGLEGQWDRGDDVSTEDLRLVLQQYRSFFDRLLSI
jgi:hypothetical protein